MIGELLDSRKGNIAILAMAMMAIVALIAGGAIDYASLAKQRREMQDIADAAALASAHELILAINRKDSVQSVAESYVAAHSEFEVGTIAEAVEGRKKVRVQLTAPPMVYFPGPVGSGAGPVVVEAVAEIFGADANVCVIALDTSANKTLSLDSNSMLDAPECAIYSNSSHSYGLSSKSNAVLSGEMICSAGGKDGENANFKPQPIIDCPTLEDPLAGRAPPPVGPCTQTNFRKSDLNGRLSPGVYCGGLEILGNSNVILDAGVYIIKNGRLLIDSNSKVTGEGVGFYLTGSNAEFAFESNVVVKLSAPKGGPMAGLLFFEDRAAPKGRIHRITSDHTDRLVGTIYLSRGVFLIDADQDVADQSEFTVIVANKVELKSGPRLVLNTNYGATTVPVPDGVGPLSSIGGVRIIE